MSSQWKTIRHLLANSEHKGDLYLTLINEEGFIVSANSKMTKTLQLPDTYSLNFRDIIHPIHIRCFDKALDCAKNNQQPCILELYLKNGYYHPMKWQVNALTGNDNFLCVGQKILDEERLIKFNRLGEKNYQLIMDGLGAGVIFHDDKGEIIAANQKASEILQVPLERLYELRNVQESWDRYWNITDGTGQKLLFQEAPFTKAQHTGKEIDQTIVIQLKNGEKKWLQYHCQPLFEGNSHTPYAVVSNIIDVTDEKKLSHELLERDAIFNQFMSQTPNLAWMVDGEERLIFASEAFYKYFGLNPGEALNKKIAEVVPPEVAEALYGRHLEALSSGKPVQVIEKTRKADGVSYVFHINIFPIKGTDDKKMLGGYAVSLAEKYAVEEKLRETNERLLLLTRATTDAIWEWDMQTGYIFRNDALMDMIGYQLDDPKGLSWWLRRIHPEDRNRVSDIVKESTDQGRQSWQDEYRFKCADGTYKYMRDKGYIVYENGLPVKMIGSLQDITNIRVLENRLADENLQRQKELSETVIRVLEKERTRIGHELHDNINQILSTTRLFVDMLNPSNEEETKLKEKSVSYLGMAIEEIRKLSKELVVPQLKEKNLVPSIHALIEDIQLSTSLKINFAHDPDKGILSQGKKVTIFRIVQEQFKNIIKHSQATEVDISLRCKGDAVQLLIRDNGIGFDPGLTRRGIGLSNIYERSRFYNGTVEISTSPGKGCQLEVSLPAY